MIICIENSFLRLNSGQLPVDSSDEPYTMNNPCNKQSILILYIFTWPLGNIITLKNNGFMLKPVTPGRNVKVSLQNYYMGPNIRP